MSSEDRPDPGVHRALRELLGSDVLGGLPPAEQTALRAHLDGCAACRAERAELAPLAQALRLVDPARTGLPVSPPPDLGERITTAVAAERVLRLRRDRRRARRGTALVAAAVFVAFAAGAGLIGMLSDGGAPAPQVSAAPREQVLLTSVQAGVGVTSAVLVPHTWGIEVMVTLTGLGPGQTYRAVALGRDGQRRPAGEFLGVSGRPVVCDLQAALLRKDARGFLVVDSSGGTVARAVLPA